MASEEEAEKQLNEILKQAKIEADKSQEEIEKEIAQAVKNFILSKRVFRLFDSAIEKVKKDIGKTKQEIHLSKIPNYPEMLSSLAPMLQNRFTPKQIYINPILRNAINFQSDDKVLEAKDKQVVNGIEFYSTIAIAPNTMYVLPDSDLVGVMAIPRFGILLYPDMKSLDNYADFPADIKEDVLLRLTNIEAPHRVTVPQRWIDDYTGIYSSNYDRFISKGYFDWNKKEED
jgi:hypothetical protein